MDPITATTMMAACISPEDLYAEMRKFPGPQVIDVRRAEPYAAAATSLPGALRRDPDPTSIAAWAGALEPHRDVVVACVYGHNVGETTAAALAARGLNARYLAGGIAEWANLGLPLAPKPTKPSVWVTRERPKVDRVACPWLLRRFVDPDARILYVAPADVTAVAAETGGTAFDIPGAPYTHHGENCSFDAFVQRHRPNDPALARLATIVRGADTERPDLHPASGGLFASALGMSALFGNDDRATLRHAMVLYDALYLWCRDAQQEAHRWPPAMPGAAA